MSQTLRFVLLFFCLALLLGWASDVVTLEGERTVYTAMCDRGAWQGPQCKGNMAAGARYRFRALRAHGEVIFWTAGESAPSAKYTDCTINDGRNWTCKTNADSVRTITNAMVHGRPVPKTAVATLEFHQIPKWEWAASSIGIPIFGEVVGDNYLGGSH